jgi:4-alpha-glucanotransferase
MGSEAYRFVDFLEQAGQSYWQVLPLNPTFEKGGYSPYKALSAFAGNPFLISPELLYKDGLIDKKELKNSPGFSKTKVDFDKAANYKFAILDSVFEKYNKIARRKSFSRFCRKNKGWLDDYAVFLTLRKHFNEKLWCNWDKDIRDRNPQALKQVRKTLKEEIDREKLYQYLFFSQWNSLKRYCRKKGIRIIGDMPIYVDMESADAWANPELFKLTKSKKPRFIAGVPPDLFSSTGQLWGNPVYNWSRLKKDNYKWWIARLKHNLNMCDLLRLDHFRGFAAYWQVPSNHKTAKYGRWVKAPGEDFLKTVYRKIPDAQIIAEDLGHITDDVKDLIAEFNLPKMKVLHFAFGDDSGKNSYLPHNHTPNSLVYTGTHDNNTTKGWFENELGKGQKKFLSEYTGQNINSKNVCDILIRTAMKSVSKISIIPVQDMLSLGQTARMNTPSKSSGNWRWRLDSLKKLENNGDRLARLTQIYGRS